MVISTDCVHMPNILSEVCIINVSQDICMYGLGILCNLPCPLCRRQNGQEGFVPGNYVKEVEPKKVTKVTKKKEMVKMPVRVKKKKIEKR